MSDAIRCAHVSFGYSDQLLLNDISFTIQNGEFIGIIGPNGGGKSTLLKLILGFLKPSAGTLDVFCDKIAYVPQNMKFDRHFPISALEVVLQGRLSELHWYGKFSPKDLEKGLEALALVGLEALADSPFGTLSGGQQQRVLIARALSSDPTLLLLDEPTANLDPEAERETFAILRSLKRKMTILMVTHDLQIAIDEVDRILVVQRGLISYSPKEVCEHYTLGLYHPPLLNIGKSP